MGGLQEALEESKGNLSASEVERSSLSQTQDFLEGKAADLRKELEEVRVSGVRGFSWLQSVSVAVAGRGVAWTGLVEIFFEVIFFWQLCFRVHACLSCCLVLALPCRLHGCFVSFRYASVTVTVTVAVAVVPFRILYVTLP